MLCVCCSDGMIHLHCYYSGCNHSSQNYNDPRTFVRFAINLHFITKIINPFRTLLVVLLTG